MKVNLKRLIFNLYRKSLCFERSDFGCCGENVLIHDNVFISNPKKLKFSSNIYIGPNSKLFTEGELTIDDGVVIGENVLILTSNHYYDGEDLNATPFDERNIAKKTTIGANTWIGSNSIILSGVNLQDGCVVAAGSVVTKSFGKNSIIGGNPAKLIRLRTNTELDNLPYWVERYKDNSYILK